ncbi:MAG: hypothetical protein IPK02_14535 [Candidatus Accumulibacter sp.]|uniref:Uncharacterized protein n=1 Tax=Candidatus Accumulibacter affinis TaxID=2954384 RepID=A0A935W462_9PROT|nr:hypothetical protein [Candidatus Accumulibacter affinis]
MKRRLLRVETQGDVPRIELIHDRLVGIVRDAKEARRGRERKLAEQAKLDEAQRLQREREGERLAQADDRSAGATVGEAVCASGSW